MNKTLFYFVAVVLIIISVVCLSLGAENQPTEYLGILIAVLIVTNLSLAAAKGWGIWAFLWLLLVTFFGLLVMGGLNSLINARISQTAALILLYGVRWASFIWPIAVLCVASKYLEKPEKEDAETKAKNL